MYLSCSRNAIVTSLSTKMSIPEKYLLTQSSFVTFLETINHLYGEANNLCLFAWEWYCTYKFKLLFYELSLTDNKSLGEL